MPFIQEVLVFVSGNKIQLELQSCKLTSWLPDKDQLLGNKLLEQDFPSFGDVFIDKLYWTVPLVQSPILTLLDTSQLAQSKSV